MITYETKVFNSWEFQELLLRFQNDYDNCIYNVRVPYPIWKKMKSFADLVKIELNHPFVDVFDVYKDLSGEQCEERFVYSGRIGDESFGDFLYDVCFKEDKKDMMTYTNSTSATTAVSSVSLSETNNKYYYDDNTGTIKNSDWNNSTVTSTIYIPNKVDSCDACDSVKYNTGESKEEKNMIKGVNFEFGPCGSNVRLSMYGLAIQNIAGEWVSYNAKTKEIINVDIFNMADAGKYIYKMPVAISDVKIGDVVIHNKVPMFVTAVNATTFEVTDVRAGETKSIIPTKNMFGFNYMTKVVNFLGSFTETANADQPFGNMLPFLMLGENKDLDPLMMMMFMNQNGGKINDMFSNPMMMYFLMKNNKNIDPMMMYMMNQNFTGNAVKSVTIPTEG